MPGNWLRLLRQRKTGDRWVSRDDVAKLVLEFTTDESRREQLQSKAQKCCWLRAWLSTFVHYFAWTDPDFSDFLRNRIV
jgi:hypothetical protein